MGPVEYAILHFPGASLDDQIEPALREIVDSGVVRILDVELIRRDRHGDVELLELDDARHGLELLKPLVPGALDLLREEDVDGVAAELEPDSCALVIVWEDTWATRFMAAVRAAGCDSVETARIPAPIVAAALSALPETSERSATS